MSAFVSDLSLLSVLDDLISIVDEQYRYCAVSNGYQKFFGFSTNDFIGKSAYELHGHERFEKYIKPHFDKALSGKESRLQFWAVDKNGELRFLDSKLKHFPNHSTNAVAICARDVTEQIQASEQLEKEKQLLTTMIDAMPSFIFVKNAHGVYQRCNKAFEHFMEKSHEQIIGFTDDDLMSERSANYIKHNDQKVYSGKKLRCDEWVTYESGERRLLDMLKLPLYQGGNTVEGLVGIGHDVTDERIAQSQLRLAALVFESTNEPCFILDNTGRIETANIAGSKCMMTRIHEEKPVFINEILKCHDSQLDFIKDILLTSRHWQGEVSTPDHQIYLATINTTVNDANLPDKFVLILHDISEQKAEQAELIKKAYYDFLTGLPNRRELVNHLETAIVRCQRQQRKMAVLFIDLDKFKPINDAFGHFEGDKVLIEIAARLQQEMRQVDLIARMGGDEFVVVIDIETPKQATLVAKKLIKQIEKPFLVADSQVAVSASIGISLYPQHGNDAKTLLISADQAMYAAKVNTSNISFFELNQDN